MADNNANVATSRNRWSEQEETVIAQEIIKNYDVLFGPMTGCGALKIGEVRRRGWEAVANVLNCQFSTYKRAGSEVKKKYYNMKDKTKTKNDEMRRPGTGGGPRVKEFTIPEGILLQHFGDSASVAGVPNAIDTDAPEGASINIIELGKMPIDGSTCMTFKIDERGLGAQKTSSVFQRAVEDEAGPCSSGTKTNTKSMKMANKNQSKRARASFNKLAEDNLIAEKKNIHLQQVNLRLKNQLILAQLKSLCL
ncbi:uncharacterized protein LOC127836835 [Dreissena polymorpha]|nr:uncharacterized protein LOC127836835 [Dreissena polymorpha]